MTRMKYRFDRSQAFVKSEKYGTYKHIAVIRHSTGQQVAAMYCGVSRNSHWWITTCKTLDHAQGDLLGRRHWLAGSVEKSKSIVRKMNFELAQHPFHYSQIVKENAE